MNRFTYPEVGATRGAPPAGYHFLSRSSVVGHGEADLETAAAAVLAWQAQRGSGVRVEASTATAQQGTDVVLHIGRVIKAPARVVYVLDEPRRRGFAYGTLPGHPEVGEEAFVVELEDGGDVVFTVSAFSRPGAWFTKLLPPANRLVQRLMTDRYLRAVERAVRSGRPG